MFEFVQKALSNIACVRVAFALAPGHGSDREVGWSSLEADRRAGRNVVYITSPIDFRLIATNFDIEDHEQLQLGTVRVIPWPLELPLGLVSNGYLRFFFWVVTLQIFLRVWCREGLSKIHFVTYTQLATPIMMPKSVRVYLGPVGVIPRVPWSAPISRRLALKSKVMWLLLMPVIRCLSSNSKINSAVVHPSIAKSLGGTESRVISALNVDYIGARVDEPTECRSLEVIEATVVARDVAFKNLEVVTRSLQQVSQISGLSTLVINAGKHADHVDIRGAFKQVGRQKRATVITALKASRLHVTLSVELGGYINLEAASLGVPTLCLQGYGASFMLNPSDRFMLNIEHMTSESVADRILELLDDKDVLAQEAVRQRNFARHFLDDNRQLYEDWLRDSGNVS